jgi:hypothetical protein
MTPADILEKRMNSVNRDVVKATKDCNGLIVVLPATDALMFRKSFKSEDADVHTHNSISNILEFRKRMRKPDPHIIVFLSKWDQVSEVAKDIDMDAYYSDEEMQKFLDNGFPATSMLLKPLVANGKVKFFRSWFKIAKDETGKDMYFPGTKKQKIEVTEYPNSWIRFLPNFSSGEFEKAIYHISSFAR